MPGWAAEVRRKLEVNTRQRQQLGMITPGVTAISRRFCVASLLLCVGLSWTPSTHGLLTEPQRSEIADFILTVMECRHVPGLTLGVVFGDGAEPSDVFSQGLGYKDVLRNVSVTNTTRFAIGELSSTFTVTLISKLLHAKKDRFPNGWDTTVKEILGSDFRLADDLRTDYTTLRDLAAHKTGYPHYQTLVAGLDHGVERPEYCRRYFLLKPKYEFRSQYHYSREMFTLLGCVAQVLGDGQSWEELVTSYILKPLKMTSTSFVTSSENVAMSYIHHNNSFVALDNQLLRAIYPGEVAEGVVSSADDMVRWLHYHQLNLLNLSRIQEGELLGQTYLPQMQYRLEDMQPDYERQAPVQHVVFAHNLGWESGLYGGYPFVQQSGQLPGFTSKQIIFRDIKLGIFISMNIGSSKKDLLTADFITWHIADFLLQVERPMFFTARRACSYESPFAHKGLPGPAWDPSRTLSLPDPPPLFLPGSKPQLSHSGPASPASTGSPPLVSTANAPVVESTASSANRSVDWEKAFVGSYGHQMFGNVTISYETGIKLLSYKAGVVGSGFLDENGKKEEFIIKFSGPLSYMHKISPEQEMNLKFKELKDGKFVSLTFPEDDIVYVRDTTWELPHSSSSSGICVVFSITWTACLLTLQFIFFS